MSPDTIHNKKKIRINIVRTIIIKENNGILRNQFNIKRWKKNRMKSKNEKKNRIKTTFLAYLPLIIIYNFFFIRFFNLQLRKILGFQRTFSFKFNFKILFRISSQWSHFFLALLPFSSLKIVPFFSFCLWMLNRKYCELNRKEKNEEKFLEIFPVNNFLFLFSLLIFEKSDIYSLSIHLL